MKIKKFIIFLCLLILLIGSYFLIVNIKNPIKDVYVYSHDPNVTLVFKNGKYIFNGKGEHFDYLVQTYGNNRFYALDLVYDKNEQTYNPVEGTQSKHYYLAKKSSDDDFPIIVSVYEKGELRLHFQGLSTSDIFYIKNS